MAGPTYVYTSNTPQSPNPMNGTQPIILANFQAINELINVNHVGFNSSTTGKHNFANMQLQSSIPTTASTDLTLFTQATPSGPNDAELFIQYPNQEVVQISDVTINPNGTSFGTSGNGYVKFASGVSISWGTTPTWTSSSKGYYITNLPQYIVNDQPGGCATPTSSGGNSLNNVSIGGGTNGGVWCVIVSSSNISVNAYYLMMGM